MNVSMSGHGPGTLVVSEVEGGVLGDAPDAGEADLGEPGLPPIEHRDGILLGDGEEQFEILAIGEGGEDRRFGAFTGAGPEFGGATDGQTLLEQFRAHRAGGGQVSEIAGETVAEIDHGVHLEMFGQPPRLGEARLEIEMMPGQGTAELARNEQGVARLSAGTAHGAGFFDRAEGRDGQEEAVWIGGGFAADDGDVPALSRGTQSVVHAFDAGRVEVCGEGERDDDGGGFGGGGGEVAQHPGEGFVADAFGRRVGCEMDAFDDGVGLQDDPVVGQSEIEEGTVVAGAGNDLVIGGQIAGEAGDEIEFVHDGLAGGGGVAGWQGQDPEEVGGIEEGVAEDWRGEVARLFVEPGPEDAEHPQGEKGGQVGVDEGEEEGGEHAARGPKTAVAQGGPEHAAEDQFLEDGRGAGREQEQQAALPGAGSAPDGVDGCLGIGGVSEEFEQRDAGLMHPPGAGEGRERAAQGEQGGAGPGAGEQPEAVAPSDSVGVEEREQGGDADGVKHAGGGGELPGGWGALGGAERPGEALDDEGRRGKGDEQRGEKSQRWFEAPRLGRLHGATLPWPGLEVRGFGRGGESGKMGARLDGRDLTPRRCGPRA